MKIENKQRGQSARPLECLTFASSVPGTLVVQDALAREYFRAPTDGRVAFTVGGALGHHRATLLDEVGAIIDSLVFPVRVETGVRDETGRFTELLTMLNYTMIGESGEVNSIRWNGRIYRFFISWLRDHVHVLKGMKYFAAGPVLKDAIDLYRHSQRADGMIWDNAYPRSPQRSHWDDRFKEGDFIRPFDDLQGEFKRIPVENDVEYLFVEGLYYTWKATGDDAWMAAALDSAVRALEYSVTDPCRWSIKYALLKRGYTIDTWDFQNQEDAVVNGDEMRVDPRKTRFGVMFGDNTGYIAACRYLAEMLRHAGRQTEAQGYFQRAVEMKERLDKLAWNGNFYRHHVREDQDCPIDLGVDEGAQVSLSNAYSLNRGLDHAQCAAIIRTYLGLRDALPENCPGEWFTIYPPFGQGFGGSSGKWQYMNASVTPIVAGELAHGAFEHGFESYGADILERLAALGRRHGGVFHSSYTGSLPAPPARTFMPLDLSAQANISFDGQGAPGVSGWTGEGDNDLHEMPVGPQRLAGIDFLIADPARNGRRACLGLRKQPGYAEKIEIAIGRAAASIYLLHTVSATGPGNVGGTLKILYADGGEHVIYIVRGKNVSGWWQPSAPSPSHSAVAWRGRNACTSNVGIVAWGFDNPHPSRPVASLVLEAARDGAFWAVLGLTLSEQPVWFPVGPISHGIPNGWGAGAVVYALVEGLAGVVDGAVAYDHVRLSPRWIAATVNRCEVAVTYPVSGGYVAYDYRHDPSQKTLTLSLTGSGETCACHVLLPPGARASSVTADGHPIPFTHAEVAASPYVDFVLASLKPRIVAIRY